MRPQSLGSDPDRERSARTKERLLLLLKTRGGMTTKALAAALGVSVPAVRRQLLSLGNVVAPRRESSGVGRPPQTWHLTEQARGSFPDTHSELTVRILDSIERTLGPDALDRVIDHRSRQTLDVYLERMAPARTLPERLRRLVRLRTEEGYMAELERRDGGWLLIENHCPICAAATRCQGFCRNELELFRAVLGDGASVVREEHLLAAGRRCAYRITPRNSTAAKRARSRRSDASESPPSTRGALPPRR